MRLFHHSYNDYSALKDFCEAHHLGSKPSVLVQLFGSHRSGDALRKIRDEVKSLLPNASLIGTTSAGIIDGGSVIDDRALLSFSVFDSSSVEVASYSGRSVESILDDLSSRLIRDDTKLCLVFTDTFAFDAAPLLDGISAAFPTLLLSGGQAGDDFRFEACEVLSDESDRCDVVIAAISSETLRVSTHYLMNWRTIGQKMRVTKAIGSEVFEINGVRTIDLYRRYLGSEIADNLLIYGIKFPLIYRSGNVEIARALVAYNEESGSITFAGEIPQGCEVQFGFADIDAIEHANLEYLKEQFPHRHEALYIYSCGARRQMLGSFLESELMSLTQIAPTCGFVTYGEFYHDGSQCRNDLLNITTTFTVLDEGKSDQKTAHTHFKEKREKHDILLKALTTLVAKTSIDLEENLHYLEQFKNAVDEASIFSVADKRGIIIEANDNFAAISGYTKEELIGMPHSIVRSPDVPREVFKEMWETIQAGKLWKGMIKNRRKDGKSYYVLTEIKPIFYKDGTFREYIAIRNDVTELEEYKQFLKNELDITSKNFEESIHYAEQYEKAINASTAILKTDTDNIIKYANEKFCEISGYTHSELIGRNCEELRHEKHRIAGICTEIRRKLASGESVYETLTNIAKDGSEYVISSLFFPVFNGAGNVIEHIQVMHDITQIVHLNEEIIKTQKEVVFTMGAIGETRSKETGAHVKRVAEYSYRLARLCGFSEEDATLLKRASPMHDIGKVAIPDAILNKPGKLTEEEFEVMKTHSTLGYEMLRSSERPILKASAIIAYTHHEKYNGRGYPRGLKGEEIPLFGRITAIADVFDALGHDRVYKKAWPLEEILELFRKERGEHFDPMLIDLFMEHLDEFLAIRDYYDTNELT
jgi:PAS domain S-box-containing protein